MLGFNSASLRYKFIYLTKNIYHGIAIHSLFEEAFQASKLHKICDADVPFFLIDKYINFIPFSLRFENAWSTYDKMFEQDIILFTNRLQMKRIPFSNILFFVDMYNPEQTSFLYISKEDTVSDICNKLDFFMHHCAAVVGRDKKNQCPSFGFTLREQQIIFYMLTGKTVKEISQMLDVSDKSVYRGRDILTRKLELQLELGLKRKLRLRYKQATAENAAIHYK